MKFLRVLVLGCAATLLSGCADTGFSRYGYKRQADALTEDVMARPIVIQYQRHYSTNDVEVLGSIHAYDTDVVPDYDEVYVLEIFCDDGRVLNADVVNITEQEHPDYFSSHYRARAEFLRFKDRSMAQDLVSDPQYAQDLVEVRSGVESGDIAYPTLFHGMISGTIAHEAFDHSPVGQLEQVALNGDPDAQLSVGLDYESGHGVPQSYACALPWFQLSAYRGNPIAQNDLAGYYLYGLATDTNYDQAFNLYEQSAEQGYAPAQCNMGYMCQNGLGVETNKAAAVTCYRAAAQQGYLDGMMNLGMCYREGNGIARDPLIAYMWMDCASRLAEQSPDAAAKSKISASLNTLKQQMTPDQIKQGDTLANQWYDSFQKTHSAMTP